MRKIIIGLLIGTSCVLITIFWLDLSWPADTPDDRLTRLEKQVEAQQREIIFLYAQINYTDAKQIKEPKELKEAIKRYTKKTR
jgi:uncharacterized protein YbaA (DUF1428 family)